VCPKRRRKKRSDSESQRAEREERRERGEAKKNKESLPKDSCRTYWFGLSTLVGCVGCGEPRTRDLRFRECEDRSDVLFELSAAEDRRLYMPESARDQSDTYLMLMACFPVDEPCIRFVGQLRD
jgi:hypothetical protein